MASSPVTRPGVVTINGKRMSSTRAAGGQQESPNHAHEDNVRFVSQAWQRVERELRMCRDDGPLSYREKEPNPELRNFVPVNLEELSMKQEIPATTEKS